MILITYLMDNCPLGPLSVFSVKKNKCQQLQEKLQLKSYPWLFFTVFFSKYVKPYHQ